MASIDIEKEQAIAAQLATIDIDDQLLVADHRNSGLVLFNRTGRRIWNLYRQGDTVQRIGSILQAEYGISLENAVADAGAFLDYCRDRGLFYPAPQVIGSEIWGTIIRSDTQNNLSAKDTEFTRSYRVIDSVFNIIYADQTLFAQIHPVIAHIQCDSAQPDLHFRVQQIEDAYLIESDYSGYASTRLDTLDELIEILQLQITDLSYRGREWLTLMHASAIGVDNDKAVALVAPKGHGKTTLTALLQEYGLVYLSDDTAPITEHGTLRPLPLCQRLKEGSWALVKYDQAVKPTRVFARNEGRPVKYVPPRTGSQEIWQREWAVGAIIYPQFQTQTDLPQLQPLGLLKSLQTICASESVFGGVFDQHRLHALVRWLEATPAYSLVYSQVDERLLQLIHQSVAHS